MITSSPYHNTVSAVARIALVKPEKARGVEDVLLRAAQVGQIVEKVTSLVFLFLFVQLLWSLDILSMGQFDQEESLCQCLILQVSEERLISLLEQINNQTTKQTKVTVSPCYLSITKLVLRAFFI